MEEIKWDIKRGAEIYRTVYDSRLKNWISTGKMKPGEMVVWRSGFSGWRKPEELEELKPFFQRWEEHESEQMKKKDSIKQSLPPGKEIRDILIIDDEKDLCFLLHNLLISNGYNVEVANTVKAAISCINEKIFDLVLLDLKLSDGDGMNILPMIKEINPKTIVDIITAYGSDEVREQAEDKGAYRFIDKPFTEKYILNSIRELEMQSE